jgi:hypothetical protein
MIGGGVTKPQVKAGRAKKMSPSIGKLAGKLNLNAAMMNPGMGGGGGRSKSDSTALNAGSPSDLEPAIHPSSNVDGAQGSAPLKMPSSSRAKQAKQAPTRRRPGSRKDPFASSSVSSQQAFGGGRSGADMSSVQTMAPLTRQYTKERDARAVGRDANLVPRAPAADYGDPKLFADRQEYLNHRSAPWASTANEQGAAADRLIAIGMRDQKRREAEPEPALKKSPRKKHRSPSPPRSPRLQQQERERLQQERQRWEQKQQREEMRRAGTQTSLSVAVEGYCMLKPVLSTRACR